MVDAYDPIPRPPREPSRDDECATCHHARRYHDRDGCWIGEKTARVEISGEPCSCDCFKASLRTQPYGGITVAPEFVRAIEVADLNSYNVHETRIALAEHVLAQIPRDTNA